MLYSQELGWPVFPLVPSTKIPLTEHGFHDATTDIGQIKTWWEECPNANIGVATGKAAGFFVVDVDVSQKENSEWKKGGESLELLEDLHGKLPDTIQGITGSGGGHYLFKYKEGVHYPKELAEDIDIKSDGGYIVLPPSTHPDTGKKYEWEASSRPFDTEIADPPQWLIDMMNSTKKEGITLDIAKDPEHFLGILQGVSEGSRNNSLASLTGHLLAKRVDPYVAYEIVNIWNDHRNNPPIPSNELDKTFNSILRKETDRRKRK